MYSKHHHQMKNLILFGILIGLSYQQTTIHNHRTSIHFTHPPGSTHEPNERATIIFHYDFHTGKMIIRKDMECFIFALSDREKIAIHTDSGMKTLETSLLPLTISSTRTEVHKDLLPQSIQLSCGNGITHFYAFA